jgi:hypothetical protein
MSTFPALVPSSRTFTPGDVPNVKQVSLSGMTSGFRRGNRRIAQGLSLSFQRLTQVQLDLITAHYVSRQGSFDIFFLSAEVWNGYTTPPVPLLSDIAWQYAGPPSITDSSCGRWEVDVDLQTIPIDTGDLVFDGEGAPAAPSRLYVLDAGGAAASPARDYIISPTGAT